MINTTSPITDISTAPVMQSQFALPRRFDVHEVDRVSVALRALGADRADVTIDASAVEMIDLSGLAALTAAAQSGSVRFVHPSVAFLATARYTGHDLLAAQCESVTAEFAEAA